MIGLRITAMPRPTPRSAQHPAQDLGNALAAPASLRGPQVFPNNVFSLVPQAHSVQTNIKRVYGQFPDMFGA